MPKPTRQFVVDFGPKEMPPSISVSSSTSILTLPVLLGDLDRGCIGGLGSVSGGFGSVSVLGVGAGVSTFGAIESFMPDFFVSEPFMTASLSAASLFAESIFRVVELRPSVFTPGGLKKSERSPEGTRSCPWTCKLTSVTQTKKMVALNAEPRSMGYLKEFKSATDDRYHRALPA